MDQASRALPAYSPWYAGYNGLGASSFLEKREIAGMLIHLICGPT